MIKVDELRIGNIVEHNGVNWWVYGTSGPYPCKDPKFDGKPYIDAYNGGPCTFLEEEINPEPITDEYLKAFKFDENSCVLMLDDNLFFCKDINGDIRLGYAENYIGPPIKHVHILQNLYHDLTKKELLA